MEQQRTKLYSTEFQYPVKDRDVTLCGPFLEYLNFLTFQTTTWKTKSTIHFVYALFTSQTVYPKSLPVDVKIIQMCLYLVGLKGHSVNLAKSYEAIDNTHHISFQHFRMILKFAPQPSISQIRCSIGLNSCSLCLI